jgi:hypothetical protein
MWRWTMFGRRSLRCSAFPGRSLGTRRQEPGNEKAGAWEREGRSLGTRRLEPGNEKAGAWEREQEPGNESVEGWDGTLADV